MKKIKDFFHDNNDIMLAIVIIGIAVGVIFWRMTEILDYPEKMAGQSTQTQTEANE